MVGVHLVGDLDDPAHFLRFKNIGVEYSYQLPGKQTNPDDLRFQGGDECDQHDVS